MNSRYLGALTLIPVLVMVFLGGWPLKLIVTLLAARALFEFYSVTRKKGLRPSLALGFVLLAAYFAILITGGDAFGQLGTIIVAGTAAGFIMMVFGEEFDLTDLSVTITGFIYSGVLFGYLILLDNLDNGLIMVYTVFIISWVCDTFAYYTGRFFGKHKLIERVSPKKTVEGAVGGAAAGALGALAVGIVTASSTGIEPFHFLVMGLLGAVLGQVGDLAASAVKRYAGEKDYPKIIPGHGGVLDRFDSIMFVAMMVFFYNQYFIR